MKVEDETDNLITQEKLDARHLRIARDIMENSAGLTGLLSFMISMSDDSTPKVEIRGGCSNFNIGLVACALLDLIIMRAKDDGVKDISVIEDMAETMRKLIGVEENTGVREAQRKASVTH